MIYANLVETLALWDNYPQILARTPDRRLMAVKFLAGYLELPAIRLHESNLEGMLFLKSIDEKGGEFAIEPPPMIADEPYHLSLSEGEFAKPNGLILSERFEDVLEHVLPDVLEYCDFYFFGRLGFQRGTTQKTMEVVINETENIRSALKGFFAVRCANDQLLSGRKHFAPVGELVKPPRHLMLR